MNLMYAALSPSTFTCKNKKINAKVLILKEKLKAKKIKISEKAIKLGNTSYYQNALPYISKTRDVLKKPNGVCLMRVNLKKKDFTGKSTDEIMQELKPVWGWNVTLVDEEHTRNKFQNKENIWAIFDTEQEALENMAIFNSFFITAIELDAIEEYKRFKENPAKRPLTFDQIIDNAYELYDEVDKGIM